MFNEVTMAQAFLWAMLILVTTAIAAWGLKAKKGDLEYRDSHKGISMTTKGSHKTNPFLRERDG